MERIGFNSSGQWLLQKALPGGVIIGSKALELHHPSLYDNKLNADWDAYYMGNGKYTHNPHDALVFPTPEAAYEHVKKEYPKFEKTMIHPTMHYTFNFNPKEVGTVEKSNYGPKGAGLYDPNANAKRKAKNVETVEGVGPNANIKQYAPTGMSAKQKAKKEAVTYNKMNRKQPIKRYTPEEIEQLKTKKVK